MTEVQGEWLNLQKKNFIDTQVQKDTCTFINATTQAFIKKWPVATPTAQEIVEEGGLDAACKAKMEAQHVVSRYHMRYLYVC